MSELYKTVVLDIYKTHKGNTVDQRREIAEQIAKLNIKLANARDLLFDGKLETDDYAIMKKDYEQKIKTLEDTIS